MGYGGRDFYGTTKNGDKYNRRKDSPDIGLILGLVGFLVVVVLIFVFAFWIVKVLRG